VSDQQHCVFYHYDANVSSAVGFAVNEINNEQVALLVKDLIDGKYPEELIPWYVQ
jgi:hypothetical protein